MMATRRRSIDTTRLAACFAIALIATVTFGGRTPGWLLNSSLRVKHQPQGRCQSFTQRGAHRRSLLVLRGGDGSDGDVETKEASHCRKGALVLLKDKPCRVSENAVSKVGKHGAAKCHIIGIDVFTGKKVEEVCPGHTMMKVPSMKKTDYQLIDVGEDGTLSLMDENNELKDDVELPEDATLAGNIKKRFQKEEDLDITVMKCLGREVVIGVKASKNIEGDN
eukprot:jgi/Bigna1/56755/estExt_Genewise1Plus.C_1190011